ncbi:CAF17-like 4Fe-4S cluster assembly/insertion protein YgfZ [Corynebacterium gerontici]|nr:folate-binding protein [Corynebacterium gerontici]
MKNTDSLHAVSPLLQLPGATALSPEDDPTAQAAHPGVAWHYGDPLSEQRVFEPSLALIDRSHRTVIAVSGEDAPAFLNNLLSQKLDQAEHGFAAQALNLDAQGRIVHQMDVLFWNDIFYLDCEPADAPTLLDYLQKMVFWSKVEISTPEIGILTLIGTLPARDWEHPHRMVEGFGLPRLDLLVAKTELFDVATSLIRDGATATGLMAYQAQRVRSLMPERSLDLDEKSIPHESPVLLAQAVHLHKGCYRGQETVARVENLGRSPRVVVLVHLDGSAPTLPLTGEPITAGASSRALGRIGTVVHDYEYGPVALAVLKRSAVNKKDLRAGEVAVAVDHDSVPVDGGTPAGREAIERLQGRR